MPEKILLCWNYERKNWILPLEHALSGVEICYINYKSAALERTKATLAPVFYWNDFKSINHLLQVVKPTKVVFMGLDSPYTILLNYSCKIKGIKTFFLQHGIFHSIRAYMYEEQSMKKNNAVFIKKTQGQIHEATQVKPNSKSPHFLLRSLSPLRIPAFYSLTKFMLLKRISGSHQKSIRSVAREALQTDKYIVFTKYLARVLAERDKVKDEKFLEIGNEEANHLIIDIISHPDYSYDMGDYFLFIDEAFSGSPSFSVSPIVNPDLYNRFLTKMATFAAEKNKPLYVKLHPYSFDVDFLVSHPNIKYIKEANNAELIRESCGIIGFSSTLLLPAMFTKPACIFRLNRFSDIHSALDKIAFCPVLDFEAFEEKQIYFYPKPSEEQKSAFINYFLYKVDNNCEERLKKILLSDHA